MNLRIKYYILIFVVFIFIHVPNEAFPQIGVNVYEDTVYDYLDKLAAKKCIRNYNSNQKPLSKYSVAYLIIDAEKRCLDPLVENNLAHIVRELKKKFVYEINVIRDKKTHVFNYRAIEKANIYYTATDEPEELMFDNNLSQTSGTVQPLLSYKEGRHFRGYSNLYFNTVHWMEVTPFFAAYIQPDFYATSGNNPKAGPDFHRLYLKTGYKNFEFQAGRDTLIWGPAKNNLLFSGNARNLDMIRLTSVEPFKFPWVFKHLGDWQMTAFFSWLGMDYSPSNAILSGYRIDWQPLFWLDLAFNHSVIMGGSGAKDPSVGTAIGEFIGFIFDSGNNKASSNHEMGADIIVTIPTFAGMKAYVQMILDDRNCETDLFFHSDSSWIGGVYFPSILKDSKLSLRAEFIATGHRAYRHYFYTDGFSLDGKFFGYDSGSDTYSAVLISKYIFNIDEYIGGSFRYLQRSGNSYTTAWGSGGMEKISVLTSRPSEKHFLMKIFGKKRLNNFLSIYGETGLDIVRDVQFVENNSKTDFSAQVGFQIDNF